MPYYATELDYLYNFTNTDTKKPYKVDNLLFNYSDTSTNFANILPLITYYVALTTVTLGYQNASDVDDLSGAEKRQFFNPTIQNTVSVSLPSACQALDIDASQAGNNTPTVRINTSDTFTGDIEKTDINVTINTTTTSATVVEFKTRVLNNVHQRIGLLGKTLIKKPTYSNKTLQNLFGSVSRREFDMYLYEINTSIASSYFRETYEKIASTQTETVLPVGLTEEQIQSIEEGDRIRLTAIANLKLISVPWKFDPLMALMREASQKTLYYIINNTPSFNGSEFIKAFASRSTMSSGNFVKFYYRYRSLMYDYFKIDKKIVFEDDNKVDLFMRKLLVDIYIKACYPLIHYDMIDILMKRYTEYGDFVNARFALLAKCLFSFQLVNELISGVPDNSIPTTIRVDFSTNMIAYIQRNNRGDINSNGTTEDKLKQIVTDLHDMSNSVVDNSAYMEILGQAIRQNQLAMRSLISALEEKKKELQKFYTEFYIIVSLLLVMIAACGVLYFLEIYDYGMITAAVFFVSILIYNLIMMIISFIQKN